LQKQRGLPTLSFLCVSCENPTIFYSDPLRTSATFGRRWGGWGTHGTTCTRGAFASFVAPFLDVVFAPCMIAVHKRHHPRPSRSVALGWLHAPSRIGGEFCPLKFSGDVSEVTQHGTCIPISCGLNKVSFIKPLAREIHGLVVS
jgi:hypothetical protein